LEAAGKSKLAVISVPTLKRTYTAIEGQGAFCNDQPLQVSDRQELSSALVATGFITAQPEKLKQQIECFGRVLRQCRGVRRAGSAAFDLAMVAQGVYDAYWEANLQPWDTSAGYLLVKEAGGRVSRFDGAEFDSYQPNILASNGRIHDQIQQLVHPLSCQK
jgi:myo-inositol-1(or 4)-monophosphatase